MSDKITITREDKTAIAKIENTQSALAAIGPGILEDAQNSSGFENIKPEDVAIPFIKILQALSPECKKGTRVGDAEEGDFFNTVTQEIFKGEIRVVPCAYQKAYVEWKPRTSGGGFVKQHFDSSILDQTKKDDNNNDVLPNGNHIVTTAYHFCLLVKDDGSFDRVVIAMTSTQLKKSRRWISQMRALQIPVGNKKINPPMYSHIYPISSVPEQNDKGAWSGFAIGNPTMISTRELYESAKAFYQEVTAGVVKTAEPVETDLPTSEEIDISKVEDKF